MVIPYGGDYFMYSQIIDPVFRNGLLINYPAAGRREAAIANTCGTGRARPTS